MPTISAMDPGQRYDDADKEAEAARQAANDFMFRARLQQQAEANQVGLQGGVNASNERMNSANILDRESGRAADLNKGIQLDGTYKQKANDTALHDQGEWQNKLGLEQQIGQNQLGVAQVNAAPQQTIADLQGREYSDRSPAIIAQAKTDAAKSNAIAGVIGDAFGNGGGSAPAGPAFPFSGAQSASDPMGLYEKVRSSFGNGAGGGATSDTDRRALRFGLLGINAPVDPNVEANNAIRDALIKNLSSPDPKIRASAATELRNRGINAPAGGLDSGGLNTTALDEVQKLTTLVNPDIADLTNYMTNTGGYFSEKNKQIAQSKYQGILAKAAQLGASPEATALLKQQLDQAVEGALHSRGGWELPGSNDIRKRLNLAGAQAPETPGMAALKNSGPLGLGLGTAAEFMQ